MLLTVVALALFVAVPPGKLVSMWDNSERGRAFREFFRTEEEYVFLLDVFVKNFVQVIEIGDTPEKVAVLAQADIVQLFSTFSVS